MAEPLDLITTIVSTPRQRRYVLMVLTATVGIFAISAPFAQQPLPELWSIVPANHTALVIIALITALLLFGQVRILGSWAILLLACGYLYSAYMAAAHSIISPAPFAPSASPDTAANASEWLYFLWQDGFAVWVILYGIVGAKERNNKTRSFGNHLRVLPAILATLALATTLTAFTFSTSPVLPILIRGDELIPLRYGMTVVTWLCPVIAVIILWTHRPRTLLDIWLLVILSAWVCDTTLADVLSHARFDVGWYTGRLCGLLADSLLLIMLLYENSMLYARLVVLHTRERKLSAERLRASETRFQAVFEQTGVGIALSNLDGQWLRVNRKLCSILGYSAAQLMQRKVQDVVEQGGLESKLETLHKKLAQQRPAYAVDTRCLCKDGSTVWVHLTAVLTHTPAGRPDNFIFTIEDIQSRKDAEIALRQSEQRFRTVFDQATVAICILDKETGSVIEANRMALANLGFETLEALQKQDIGLAWLGSPELARERITSAAAGIDQHFEIRRTDHQNAPPYWGDVLLTKVHLNGKDRLLAVISNVTERKKLEQEVIKASTAEQARIGHEIHDGICQQLTGISMLAGDLYRRLLKTHLTEEAATIAEVSAYLRETLAEARRLASGLAPVEIAANGLAEALVHLASQVSNTTHIDCRVETDNTIRAKNTESATHLFRIAQEALQNAAKHSRAHHIDVTLNLNNTDLILTIRDDGNGFDLRSNSGSGLGLHTMAYRASILGGQLHIQSSENAGTVVRCIIPR